MKKNLVSKEYLMIDRNYDKSIGLGIEVCIHKHLEDFPKHGHIVIIFFAWFIEFQIGKCDINENN